MCDASGALTWTIFCVAIGDGRHGLAGMEIQGIPARAHEWFYHFSSCWGSYQSKRAQNVNKNINAYLRKQLQALEYENIC